MTLKSLTLGVAFCCAAIVAHAQTEQVTIPVGMQAEDLKDLQRPTLGMSRADVVRLYGQPIGEKAATGTPPISSYEYRIFYVFFEGDTVLHTVMKQQKPIAP